jgi:tetratricopeptide (TPR) repeat protein
MDVTAESDYRLPEQILFWSTTMTSATGKTLETHATATEFKDNRKSPSMAELTGPAATTALLQAGIAHHLEGRGFEASRIYREILASDPGHAQANHNLGAIELAAGSFALALGHFRLALLADPSQGQYWLSCAEGLLQSGQVQAARAVFGQALRQGLNGTAADHLARRLEPAEKPDPELKKMTAHAERPVLGRKPAPVQCGWIGYLGTSGLRSVDCFFADKYFLPPGDFDRFFAEKLVYLPAIAAFEPSPLSARGTVARNREWLPYIRQLQPLL